MLLSLCGCGSFIIGCNGLLYMLGRSPIETWNLLWVTSMGCRIQWTLCIKMLFEWHKIILISINEWCCRTLFCTVTPNWARDNQSWWDKFWYESYLRCRIDRSTCWSAVQCAAAAPLPTPTPQITTLILWTHNHSFIWPRIKGSGVQFQTNSIHSTLQ